ncbi:response regulator [Pelomonas sp. V22]|uniref:response regulator n=1 Tax=Pelomonas sp. V22 TaxID=2822139 RepID=UPI0024A9C938|nr:response regulator [Pelomonas sp. V22]
MTSIAHHPGYHPPDSQAFSDAEMTSPQTQVMVVDDEPELRTLLGEYFQRHGLQVLMAADAAEARELLQRHNPGLLVLDVNMPGENGLSLARWLRETRPQVGIVMLTTASDPVDRIVGLELGADDYLPKPFELRELLARVRAVTRRLAERASAVSQAAPPAMPPADSQRVAFGACRLDLEQRRLFDGAGGEIEITAAEFDLLALFARHPNRPLNRDQIMEQAHNRGWDVFDRSIDLRIMRLRRKIERNPDKPELIKTVRNVGYVFVPGA